MRAATFVLAMLILALPARGAVGIDVPDCVRQLTDPNTAPRYLLASAGAIAKCHAIDRAAQALAGRILGRWTSRAEGRTQVLVFRPDGSVLSQYYNRLTSQMVNAAERWSILPYVASGQLTLQIGEGPNESVSFKGNLMYLESMPSDDHEVDERWTRSR
jgi:hypothetical protein